MKLSGYLFFMAVLFSANACDIQELPKMYEQTNGYSTQVAKEIEDIFGAQSTVNYKYHNDILVNVTVSIYSSDIQGITTDELGEVIYHSVENNFKQTPAKLDLILILK